MPSSWVPFLSLLLFAYCLCAQEPPASGEAPPRYFTNDNLVLRFDRASGSVLLGAGYFLGFNRLDAGSRDWIGVGPQVAAPLSEPFGRSGVFYAVGRVGRMARGCLPAALHLDVGLGMGIDRGTAFPALSVDISPILFFSGLELAGITVNIPIGHQPDWLHTLTFSMRLVLPLDGEWERKDDAR